MGDCDEYTDEEYSEEEGTSENIAEIPQESA